MFSLDGFRTARWIRTANLVLQGVLVLTFLAGLNYLVRNQDTWRRDLTRYRHYTLSAETLSYLKNLQRPVRIVATDSDDNDAPEVRGLLEEYKHASAGNPGGRIEVEHIDVFQDARAAETLGVQQADVVVVICGEKRRVVPLSEMYDVKNHVRTHFKGEQAITAALLDVSSPERKKIYFVTGHGELRTDDVDPVHGLSEFRYQLSVRNFDVDTLDLTAARGVPADAQLLIVASPQTKYTAVEQETLRQYVGNQGRILLMLSPGTNPGLEDLLLDWGVLVDDDIIWDTGSQNIADNGDLLVRTYIEHPITKTVASYGLPLRLSFTRTVRPDPGRALGAGLNTVAVAATSETAWGELSYRQWLTELTYHNPHAQPRYDAGIDIKPLAGMEPKGRLSLAVASERVSVKDNLPFSVRGGRLFAIGTGDIVANGRMAISGNLNLILSAVNWAADRDTQLNIPARPIERFQLTLSEGDMLKLRYTLLFALPGIAAVMGLLVYWARRR